MHKIEEIIHLLTEDKTRCMKKRKSISTPIRSRWPLASETTFVSWTGARSAPLNLPRVSVSPPEGKSTFQRVVQHPSCLQRCLPALSSISQSPASVYECKWVWESGVFFRDLCKRRRSMLMEVYYDE